MKSSNALQQQQESHKLIIATSSTASEHWLPFVSLMNQSTIYRRHEARLARSYALRDDPRPAALRVLSGLPIFRIIVPPYQAGESESEQYPSTPRIGDFSEETVFSTRDDAQQQSIARITTLASSTTQQQVLQAMLATLAAGGMGEYFLGGHVASKQPISPFGNSMKQAGSTSYSPFLRANGDSSLGVYLFKGRQHTGSSLATAAKPSMAMAAAASTSLLFGSRVLLEQSLLQTTHDNTANMSSSLLSSALAGGVVGVANVAVTAVAAARRTMPSSLHSTTAAAGPQNVIGRHMLAAILYFAAYDGVSLLISSNNEQKKSTAQIMTAGAVAGSVQAAVLRHGMISAAARAAPIHAMVFYAYESMKEGMQQ